MLNEVLDKIQQEDAKPGKTAAAEPDVGRREAMDFEACKKRAGMLFFWKVGSFMLLQMGQRFPRGYRRWLCVRTKGYGSTTFI